MNYQNLIVVTPKNQAQRKIILEVLKRWEDIKIDEIEGVYLKTNPIKDA